MFCHGESQVKLWFKSNELTQGFFLKIIIASGRCGIGELSDTLKSQKKMFLSYLCTSTDIQLQSYLVYIDSALRIQLRFYLRPLTLIVTVTSLYQPWNLNNNFYLQFVLVEPCDGLAICLEQGCQTQFLEGLTRVNKELGLVVDWS